MYTTSEIIIPAREGWGVKVYAGQLLDITDLEGNQVADLIAFLLEDPDEYMSPAHTVSCNGSISLEVASQLFSNHRNPVFTIIRDDVGRHDIIVPCCDRERYARDFGLPEHPNCLDNLKHANKVLDTEFELSGEMAWNVFMHNRIASDGKVVTDPASQPAGSTITIRAERDLGVLVSACPQDLTPCNNFAPTSIKVTIRDEVGSKPKSEGGNLL